MKLAISIGDLNGIGIEIALKAHKEVAKICQPTYLIDDSMLQQASKLLKQDIPKDFKTQGIDLKKDFTIKPGMINKESGQYAYDSFLEAILLAESKEVDAIVTLPIHKAAWEKANIPYKGHTDMLASFFQKEAIMMIGCPKLFVALFTHHIPLKNVPSKIETKALTDFMLSLYHEIKEEKIGVLGLNPHAGDEGLMGDEETTIQKAIDTVNATLKQEVFVGPLVPDTAFTPSMRKEIQYFVCMYHDQGLIPTKALYFDEGINVSLNLPIIRTSVDHGTAFDIAYQDKEPSTLSYINAIKEAIRLGEKRGRLVL